MTDRNRYFIVLDLSSSASGVSRVIADPALRVTLHHFLRMSILCLHVFLESQIRVSCTHQANGARSRIVQCMRLSAATTARKCLVTESLVSLPQLSILEAFGHCDNRPNSRSRAPTLEKRSAIKLASNAIKMIVTLLQCERLARQNADCDQDCCNRISLRPVTKTPKWLAAATDAQAMIAKRCRRGTDELPWAFRMRLTHPWDLSKRARRTALDDRLTDTTSFFV